MSTNTLFNKTLACLPAGELEWTEMFSAPAAEELTARSSHGQRRRTSPAMPSCTQQTRWCPHVFLSCDGQETQSRVLCGRHRQPPAPGASSSAWESPAHGARASCYFGMFMPQKVLLNTSKINKPSRPKAAETTFCGLIAPDFISSLRSKARLLHLTFPLLFQTQEQGVRQVSAAWRCF